MEEVKVIEIPVIVPEGATVKRIKVYTEYLIIEEETKKIRIVSTDPDKEDK